MKWYHASVILVVAVAALTVFVLQPAVNIVSADSMQPTLLPHDIVLCIAPFSIEYGDIVVIRGVGQGQDMIKRVIGLPYDRFYFRDKNIYLNGQQIEKKYLGKLPLSNITDLSYSQDLFGKKFEIYESYFDFRRVIDVELREREYFVLGDNRDFSVDSRDFGPVEISNVVCKAVSILGTQANEDFILDRGGVRKIVEG